MSPSFTDPRVPPRPRLAVRFRHTRSSCSTAGSTGKALHGMRFWPLQVARSRCDTWRAAIESRPHSPHGLTRECQDCWEPHGLDLDVLTSKPPYAAWIPGRDVAACIQRDVSTVQRGKNRRSCPCIAPCARKTRHGVRLSHWSSRRVVARPWRTARQCNRTVNRDRRTGRASVPLTGAPAARLFGARRHPPNVLWWGHRARLFPLARSPSERS